jgi:hypothetical protein
MNQNDYEKQQKISIEILKDYKPVYVSNHVIFNENDISRALIATIQMFRCGNWNPELGNNFKFRICGEVKLDE